MYGHRECSPNLVGGGSVGALTPHEAEGLSCCDDGEAFLLVAGLVGIVDARLVILRANVGKDDGLEVPNQARVARGIPVPPRHSRPEGADIRRPSAFVLIRATHGRIIMFESPSMT